MTARSIALFIAAAMAEIGDAYLVRIGLREHKGALYVALGAVALAIYRMCDVFTPARRATSPIVNVSATAVPLT